MEEGEDSPHGEPQLVGGFCLYFSSSPQSLRRGDQPHIPSGSVLPASSTMQSPALWCWGWKAYPLSRVVGVEVQVGETGPEILKNKESEL